MKQQIKQKTNQLLLEFSKAIILLIVLIGLLQLFGCSASYHLRRAQIKDPTLFDTTISVRRIELERLSIEPFRIPKQLDTLYFTQVDTLYDHNNILITDTTRATFFFTPDSLSAEIDCPDPIIIDESKTIKIKPTIWERLKDSFYLLLAFLGIFVIFRIVKQFI